MQIDKSLRTTFNTPETVFVVSTYPRRHRTYDPKALAVAPVAKNKINAMKSEAEKQGKTVKFVVLADNLEGEEYYEEDGHLIVRCWTRNNLDVYLSMQKIMNQFPKAKAIHFEHEFGIFGLKNTITAQLPLFFLYNRLRGRTISMVLHQVIFNLEKLSGHLQIDPNSWKIKLFNSLLRVNYFMYGILATNLVVLDQSLKAELSKYVRSEKITALPHGNKNQPIEYSKEEAREMLQLDQDTFYVVMLGYVTWYKGADWLVDTFNAIKHDLNTETNIELIIAGGESSSMVIDEKYMTYYNNLKQTIEKSSNISITGVLDSETELDTYARAADILVMPYRLMMSSSGIFAIAQNAQTPVILSEHLKPYTEAQDIQYSLQKAKLEPEDLVFTYSNNGLREKIVHAANHPEYLEKLQTFMTILAEQRTDQVQALDYLNLLQKSESPSILVRTVRSLARATNLL